MNVELAVVVKGLSKLNLLDQELEGKLTVVIRIDLSEVPQPVRDAISLDTLGFRVNDTPFRLNNLDTQVKEAGNSKAFTVRFSESLPFNTKFTDWRSFPFDVVRINFVIEMTSFYSKDMPKVRFNLQQPKTTKKGISFKENFNRLCHMNVVLGSEGFVVQSETKTGNDKATTTYFPKTCVSFELERDPTYTLVSVVVPLLVLDALSIAGLWINDGSTQLGSSLTAILAIVAILPFAHEIMPYPIVSQMDLIITLSLIPPLLLGVHASVNDSTRDTLKWISLSVAGLLALYVCLRAVKAYVRLFKHRSPPEEMKRSGAENWGNA